MKKTWFARVPPFGVPVPINLRGLFFLLFSVLAMLAWGHVSFTLLEDGELGWARLSYAGLGAYFLFYFIVAFRRSEKL